MCGVVSVLSRRSIGTVCFISPAWFTGSDVALDWLCHHKLCPDISAVEALPHTHTESFKSDIYIGAWSMLRECTACWNRAVWSPCISWSLLSANWNLNATYRADSRVRLPSRTSRSGIVECRTFDIFNLVFHLSSFADLWLPNGHTYSAKNQINGSSLQGARYLSLKKPDAQTQFPPIKRTVCERYHLANCEVSADLNAAKVSAPLKEFRVKLIFVPPELVRLTASVDDMLREWWKSS